ncbi:MAG: YHYH protein [Myxococcota bacterium]
MPDPRGALFQTALLAALGGLACSDDDPGETIDSGMIVDVGLETDAGTGEDAGDGSDAGAAQDSDAGSPGLHAAFAEFDSTNVQVYVQDGQYVIESNGLANHTSPYWSSPNHASRPGDTPPTEAHPLFVEPTVTSYAQMAPGYIDDFDGMFSLTVSTQPQRAASPSATGLGPIGIAVSGGMIYNDEEGPNVPLDRAVGSLDYSGAHTGPQSYHYHLEPKAWSDDDDALIGIIADGFFLYGRRCPSAGGGYPDDLDVSGGHTHVTQHGTEDEYHYHIQNETYLNTYYILFPGDYQGAPSSIR